MSYSIIELIRYFIIFFCVIMSIMTYSYGQNYGFYDFEYGEGSGWIKDCFGGHEWTLDLTEGKNNSSTSMKSTDLGKGAETLGLGASSIARIVEGPAVITFWWKAETLPSECGELSFYVNGEKKPFHDTSFWTPQLYYLSENRSYIIEWRYIQRNSKLYKGCGWIDDISVAPSFQDLSHSINLSCSICAPDLAKVGSTINAFSPLIDDIDYNWHIDGGKIIGNADNQSVLCGFESIGVATLMLEVSKPDFGSALCSKNITVTPKNWPYLNCSIQELSNYVKLPLNNITYVDSKYDPINYTYMNVIDAINNVTYGGTVIVGKGIYREEILINKPIILKGLDRNKTTITCKNNVIYVAADDVTIQNLTIQGGVNGIQIFGKNCTLIDLDIFNCMFHGIYFIKSDFSNTEGCSLRNIGVNGLYGIGIYSYFSNYNSFMNISFSNISCGIELFDTNYNLIDNSNFSQVSQGIILENESTCNNITCTNKFNEILPAKRILLKSKLKNHVCNYNIRPIKEVDV